MTFISNIEILGCSVLLGDVLISRPQLPHAEASQVVIPTVGKILNRPQFEYQIPGVAQKICILNDSLAIAWSGSKMHARSIIGELQQKLTSGSISRGELCGFLSSHPDCKEVELIGLLVEDGRVSSFNLNTPFIEQDHPAITCVAVNSNAAATHLYDAIHECYVGDLSGLSELDAAVAVGLEIGSTMLIRDFTDASSLHNFYGGGLEVATWRNGRIEKLGRIVFVFWIYDLDKKSPLEELSPIIFKLDYVADALITQRVMFKSNGEASRDSYHLQVIQPLHRSITREELIRHPPPSWDWDLMCSNVLVTSGENTALRATSWSSSFKHIDIKGSGANVDLWVERAHMQSILSFIESLRAM